MNLDFSKFKNIYLSDNWIKTFLKKGESDWLFLEQFNALRARFEYRAHQLKYQVVAVTSSISGEGKTVSSACLAINLASNGTKRVLLIDADLRKSDLSLGLGMLPQPGLSDYLSGTVRLEDIVRRSEVPNLYVVSSGTQIGAPINMLSGECFRKFMASIRDNFNFVFIDCPPVLPVADTTFFKGKVDGFLMLFRIEFTPYRLLQKAIEELEEKNIIGVVLNGVEPKGKKYYKRYYGKYYVKTGKKKVSA